VLRLWSVQQSCGCTAGVLTWRDCSPVHECKAALRPRQVQLKLSGSQGQTWQPLMYTNWQCAARLALGCLLASLSLCPTYSLLFSLCLWVLRCREKPTEIAKW